MAATRSSKPILFRKVYECRPAKVAPGLTVGYGGYIASSIHEHEALAEDLVWATLLVLVAVSLAIAVYNRTWKAVPAVGVPLLAGTFFLRTNDPAIASAGTISQ